MKKLLAFFLLSVFVASVALSQTALLNEGFEDNDPTGVFPTNSSEVSAEPRTFSTTNGTWTLFKAYRASSSPTSGSYALRIRNTSAETVGSSYFITPPLESIGNVSFDLKRGRPLKVYYSTNGGSSWVEGFVCPNTNPNSQSVNQALNVTVSNVILKIQNDSIKGDEDFDNFVVTSAGSTKVETTPSNVPTELSLKNFPNPFNPSTKIVFSVKTTGKATVRIFDIRGRELAKVFDGIARSGEIYQVPFGFEIASSGIFFARIENVDGTRTHKMVFMK